MVVLEKKHHVHHSSNTLQHSQNIDITTNHINNTQTYIGTQKTTIITPNNTPKSLAMPKQHQNCSNNISNTCSISNNINNT